MTYLQAKLSDNLKGLKLKGISIVNVWGIFRKPHNIIKTHSSESQGQEEAACMHVLRPP